MVVLVAIDVVWQLVEAVAKAPVRGDSGDRCWQARLVVVIVNCAA